MRGLGGDRAGATLAATVVAALLAPSTGLAATNLAQKAGVAGCISESSISRQCQDGGGLVGSASIALSPDNRNAYVASSGWDSVSVLTLNPADGVLAPISNSSGCFHSLTVLYPDRTLVRELGGADAIAIPSMVRSPFSHRGRLHQRGGHRRLRIRAGTGLAPGNRGQPDDQNVYVESSGTGGGIAVFERDAATGDLTQKGGQAGCLNPGGGAGCATASFALLDARAIAISPDGESVYVVSRTHDALTTYDRGAEEQLTPKPGSDGCANEAGDLGCEDGTALIDPDGVTVGANGQNVYVAASRSDAVAIFDRDATTGALTQKPGIAGCISNTGASNPMQAGETAGACQDGIAMDGVNSVAVPPRRQSSLRDGG